MLNINQAYIGQLVTYTSHYQGSKEKGIISNFSKFPDKLFVVYNCGENWEDYKNYTGSLTSITSLTSNWEQTGLPFKLRGMAQNPAYISARLYSLIIKKLLGISVSGGPSRQPRTLILSWTQFNMLLKLFRLFPDFLSFLPKHQRNSLERLRYKCRIEYGDRAHSEGDIDSTLNNALFQVKATYVHNHQLWKLEASTNEGLATANLELNAYLELDPFSASGYTVLRESAGGQVSRQYYLVPLDPKAAKDPIKTLTWKVY